jgi:choline dehydrogenase-like flavoprotein
MAAELCELGKAESTRPELPLGSRPALQTRFIRRSPPTRFGNAFRGELEKASNVRVILHSSVTALELNEAGTELRGAKARTLGGKQLFVRAKAFVLAAGGVENPRLLLASGVGNAHDLVGRFFMEHPELPMGEFALWGCDASLYRMHQGAEPLHFLMGVLVPTERTQREREILSFGAELAFPAPPGKELERVVGRARGQKVQGQTIFGKIFVRCEQAPHPENRIRLLAEKDSLGLPKVELKWKLGDQERRTLRQAVELVGTALGAAGIGRARLLGEDPFALGLHGQSHHMGTTRMHEDPKHGVVDPDCRVHGIANLYVAGSSVFPTSGSANPTLTLVALAHRLAGHLKERLES